jgi:DNA primase
MVSPAKGIWKDFSSGKGGILLPLMEHEHFTYPEAIRYLARKYNIEMKRSRQMKKSKYRYSREYVSGF